VEKGKKKRTAPTKEGPKPKGSEKKEHAKKSSSAGGGGGKKLVQMPHWGGGNRMVVRPGGRVWKEGNAHKGKISQTSQGGEGGGSTVGKKPPYIEVKEI